MHCTSIEQEDLGHCDHDTAADVLVDAYFSTEQAQKTLQAAIWLPISARFLVHPFVKDVPAIIANGGLGICGKCPAPAVPQCL